jgi:hypothetical protein
MLRDSRLNDDQEQWPKRRRAHPLAARLISVDA